MTADDLDTVVDTAADTDGEQVKESLRATVETVDSWIENNTEYFDPLRWTENDERTWRKKAFAEVGMYLHVADRAELYGEIPKRVKRLLCNRVNDPDYYEMVKRNYNDLLLHSYPFAYAHRNNELNPSAQAIVTETLRSNHIWAKERKPYQYLDLSYFSKAMDEPQNTIDPEAMLSMSIVSSNRRQYILISETVTH